MFNLGALMVWARARTFSGGSTAIFGFTALLAVVAIVGSTDSMGLLDQDCATALIGLIIALWCVVLTAASDVLLRAALRHRRHQGGNGGLRSPVAGLPGLRRNTYLISIAWADGSHGGDQSSESGNWLRA